MALTRRTTVVTAAAAALLTVGTWVALGTPGVGHSNRVTLVESSPTPTALDSPSPTPDPLPTRLSSPTASPTPSPTPSRTRPPSPKGSPLPLATPSSDPDVGTGQYASVLPHVAYGYCPCDVFSFRETVAAPHAGLSLSCVPPGRLPSGKLVTLSIRVSNSTSASLTFTELAGPRFVYLSLANDPNRRKDMNGGWADNAGHTSAANGWWSDPGADGSYQQGAGTVSHKVPAHGHLTLSVLGATVRAKDGAHLLAGPYTLEAGFLLDTQGHAWTCPAVSASVG